MTKKSLNPKNEDPLAQSLHDLTRLIVWSWAAGKTKSAAIASLTEFGFRPAEIAKFLNMPTKDVTSVLAKSKKKQKSRQRKKRESSGLAGP